MKRNPSPVYKKRNSRGTKPEFSFKVDRVKALLLSAFFLSLLVEVWTIRLYELTFIPFTYIVLLMLAPGLILTPILSTFLNRKLGQALLILHIAFNIITWGGLAMSFLLITNYYYSDGSPNSVTLAIITKGELAKSKPGYCTQRYVVVKYNRQEKKLNFGCNDDIPKARYVDLNVKTGLWGFDIVMNQEVH